MVWMMPIPTGEAGFALLRLIIQMLISPRIYSRGTGITMAMMIEPDSIYCHGVSHNLGSDQITHCSLKEVKQWELQD